jgi:hypothetical protein
MHGPGIDPLRLLYATPYVGDTTAEPTNMEPDKSDEWEWVEWARADFPAPLFTALGNVRAEGFDPLAV